MKTLFSISKNDRVYKLNTKLRCPCHLLHIDPTTGRIFRKNRDFLLIQVGKITPKGCMNTVKFGKFSLFLEQDYEQQTIPCLLTVRVNRY